MALTGGEVLSGGTVRDLDGRIVVAVDSSSGVVSGPSSKPLVVDGQLLREGSTTGARYRATGYNAHFGTDSYTTSQSLTTYEAMDKYFRQLRPNSLTRLRGYAPGTSSPNTGNWPAQLAVYDTVVAAAKANGQRLIFCFNNWSGDSNWDAFITNTAWVTGSQFLHSVAGANSYQDWVQTVVARYKGNYTIPIYDLCNEPTDGGTNTAAFATWFNTASGWIKAIDPNLLVYFGQTTGGFGSAAYQTLCSGLDLCSTHYYGNFGWLANTSTAELASADTLGKPLIVDETGVWAKEFYDATDTFGGFGAVSFEAQGAFWREQTLRMLSYPEVCSVLYYSYMDSDAGQGFTDGHGHYEPNNESLTNLAVRTVDLNGDPFNPTKLASLSVSSGGWYDPIQALMWAPGTAITTIQGWLTGSSGASGGNPLSGSWNGNPSILFTGTQYINAASWKPQDTATTWFFSLVPTATPATYGYIVAPQAASTNGEIGIRINGSNKIELVVSAVTATPTPAADVIVGTSSNTVNLNDANTLCVLWNSTASTSNGYAAGTWVIILNGILTTGTSQKTLSATQNGRLGIAYDTTSAGLQAHLLQAFFEPICETPVLRGQALAYLSRKYSTLAQF